MRKLKVLLIAAATAFMVLSLTPPKSTLAAPITCPGGQTAVHEDGTWYCQNNGDNPTGAGRHKGTGDKI